MGATKEAEQNRNSAAAGSEAKKSYRIRYEVNSPEAAPHLEAYEKAIAIMQKNSQLLNDNKRFANGLNWMRQAG